MKWWWLIAAAVVWLASAACIVGTIREVAIGKTDLRKGDFWKDVAEDFNGMMERFKSEQAEQADEPEPVQCG